MMNDTYGCVTTDFYNRNFKICSPKLWKNSYSKIENFIKIASVQCGESCATHDITFGFPFIKISEENQTFNVFNKTYIHFKLYQTVPIQTTVYSYGFISMIAEIGSYTGLLLGISVLDISKFMGLSILLKVLLIV